MLGRVTSVPYTSGVDVFELESKTRNSCAMLSWLLSRSLINLATRADRTAASPEVTVTVVRVKLMDEDVVELDKLVVDVFVIDVLEVDVDVRLLYVEVEVALEVVIDVLLLVDDIDFDVLLVAEVDFDAVVVDEVDVAVVLADVDVVLDMDVDVLLLYVEVVVAVVLEVDTDEVVVLVVSTGAMVSTPTDTFRSSGTERSVDCWLRRTMLLFPDSM